MIDFHSHILPGIDDGSSSVKESLAMLASLREQRVSAVCATSHFYATERSPERFLYKRAKAFDALCEALPEDAPQIFLGAEVLFFPGISYMKELPRLCLEGTNILLLEMPFTPWSKHMIREVRDLAHAGDYTILLAHIDRYFQQQPLRVWETFLNDGVYMQANADAFLRFSTRRKALMLLREEVIHVLGTDCHNNLTRPPRMKEARITIRDKIGTHYLAQIDRYERQLLHELLPR